jgi:hypothetical protein
MFLVVVVLVLATVGVYWTEQSKPKTFHTSDWRNISGAGRSTDEAKKR